MKKHLLLALGMMILLGVQTSWAAKKKVYSAYKDGTVTYYYDDLAESRQSNRYIVEDFPNDGHFGSYYKDIKFVRLDPSMKEVKLTSTANMFSQDTNDALNNIESITGLEYLNTSEVKNMSRMFAGCCELSSLDLSHFNTEKVVWMTGMFSSCHKIQSLDLSSFKTTNVKHMSSMFNWCKKLTSLDVSHFDISNVIAMDYMFANCHHLTTIYCNEDWSTYPSISSTNMFSNSPLIVGEQGTEWSESNSNDIVYARPDGLGGKPGYFTTTAPCAVPTNVAATDVTHTSAKITWTANSTAKKYFVRYYPASRDSYYDEEETTSTDYTLTNLIPGERYYVYVAALCYDNESSSASETVRFETVAECAAPTNLTVADVSYNTAKITWDGEENQTEWKVYLTANKNLGFKYIGTTSSPSYEFTGLEQGTKYKAKISSVCGGENGKQESIIFNTKTFVPAPTNLKATNILSTSVTLSWTAGDSDHDTWSVEIWDGVSNRISTVHNNPVTIHNLVPETEYEVKVRAKANKTYSEWSNVYKFVTPEAPTAEIYATLSGSEMRVMFDNQKNTTAGVIQKWTPGSGSVNMSDADLDAIQSVTFYASMANAAPASLDYWFSNMKNLTSVKNISNLNTAGVTTMVGMFNECTSLASLDLSSFITSRVENMNDMFSGCANLQTVDLTNFITTRVQDMSYMFYQCSNLTTIVCDNDWSLASASSAWMFNGCLNLQGGRGTVYNENETGKWYAHPDGGIDNPGYFTTYKVSEEDIAAAKENLMQWIMLATDVSEILIKSEETSGAEQLVSVADDAMIVYFDEEATMEEIDAQIVALNSEVSKWKETILSYLQQLVTANLSDLLEEGDSEACQQIIRGAIETINALTWDDSKPFADVLERLDQTLDEIYHETKIRLYEQRKAEEFTALDTILQESVSIRKIIRNGQLYILRDGRLFNLQGAEVK